MLNRDFFRILIRIAGVYLFIKIIFGVMPLVLSLTADIFYAVFPFALSFAVLYWLVRFPDTIINLFGLDKGLDSNRISLSNFDEKRIIILALFLLGGLLIVENFATFIIEVYFEIKSNLGYSTDGDYSRTFWFSMINTTIGYCLIKFRKNIANYFEKADREIKKMNDE